MPYIKVKTEVAPSAITIKQAANLAGFEHESAINSAIDRNRLDFGYAFDELKNKPEPGEPISEGKDKFGQKLVILNEKWDKFLAKKQSI